MSLFKPPFKDSKYWVVNLSSREFNEPGWQHIKILSITPALLEAARQPPVMFLRLMVLESSFNASVSKRRLRRCDGPPMGVEKRIDVDIRAPPTVISRKATTEFAFVMPMIIGLDPNSKVVGIRRHIIFVVTRKGDEH